MTKSPSLSWQTVIPPIDLLTGTLKVGAIAVAFVWLLLEAIGQFSSGSFTMAVADSIAKGRSDIYYAGGFIGFWLVLSFFVCWLLFRNGYPVIFQVDSDGVSITTQPQQRKINHRINSLLFWLSLLSARPGGMGTALLAETGQSSSYTWTDIERIDCRPDRRTIALRSSWRNLIVLYCTPENYQQTVDTVTEYYHAHADARLRLAQSSPVWGEIILRLLVYPGFALAAVLVWHSPLLTNPQGAALLGITACIARASSGKLRRFTTSILIAVIIGMFMAMAIGALEPLGDLPFIRYYRYERLTRIPYLAEFIASMVGMAVFCLAAWHGAKSELVQHRSSN